MSATQEKQLPKLVVIGLGLIGSSLAAALKKREYPVEVIGVARRQASVDYAVENNIIDRGVLSLSYVSQELKAGDIIFIAVPTLAVESTLHDIHKMVDESVTITDGASVKGSVIEAARKTYGTLPPQFVGGHPIAGSEKSGVEAANADLYVNHRVIVTPTEETGEEHLKRVTDLWLAAEAEVLSMPVDEHDIVLAATSHLPHAIAYSLVDTLANDAENENIFRYAAGGFRDFTRIASSDPQMWHDIMLANRKAVLEAIDLFQNNLTSMREVIEAEDGEALISIFKRAKSARDVFSAFINQQLSGQSCND